MKTTQTRIRAAAMVPALVLALALAACGSPAPADATDATGQAGQALGGAPAFGAPTAAYSFYEPKSEEDLRANSKYGYMLAKAAPGFDETIFSRVLGAEVLGRVSMNGASYYRLHKGGGVLEALGRAKAVPGLVFVEPEQRLRPHGPALAPGEYGEPGDPRVRSEQWGAHTTKALDAWKTHGFGPWSPVVANVDTGVRFAHEDLLGQALHAYSWYGPDGVAPLPPSDDPRPTDYMAVQGVQSTDGYGHGTLTCGVSSAVGNNGRGVAGVCWGAGLISYKGVSDEGGGGDWEAYGSIWHLAKWKRENGHAGTIPVNFSIGGRTASHFAIDMIEHGLQNGVMVIASSGNEGQRLHVYPAAYAGVTAVGATNGADARWPGSNYGRHISVVAPGLNVATTDSVGNAAYANATGTSFSAPHVTGLAAYMLTFSPDLEPGQIKTYIERNADLVGGAAGFTEECGWGRINVLKTIAAVRADRDAGRTPPSDYAPGVRIKLVSEAGGAGPVAFAPPYGANVFLYQCDEAGGIANYVASSVSGDSWQGGEAGVAHFPMLRPGRYVAKAHFSITDNSISDWGARQISEVGTTEVFEVSPGQDGVRRIDLVVKKFGVLFVQTCPTSDPARGGSATISFEIYDTGGYWFGQDNAPPTAPRYPAYGFYPLPTQPGTYWLRVRGLHGYQWQLGRDVDARGEYALCLTVDPDGLPAPPAPGSYANPPAGSGGQGSKTQAMNAGSQLVEFGKVYYGSLESGNVEGGDYYRFVIE